MNVAMRGVQNVTNALGAIGVAAGLAGVAALKIGASFDTSMSRVRAITGATAEEFKKLEALAIELGKTTVFSARDAANAMSFFALAGFDVQKIMGSLPATLDLAAAGQLHVADAADVVAKVMAGMQIPVSELGHTVDVLVKAFTTANTDLRQLGEAMKFVGPIAQATGHSIEETVAALQLLSNAGIQSTLAGTALRGIMGRLAEGARETRKVFDPLGVALKEADGRMRSLDVVIEDFNNALGRTASEGELAGLVMHAFGQRAGPGFAVLVGQGAAALREGTKALEESRGLADTVAKVMRNNLAGSFELMTSAIESVAIEISHKMTPALRGLMSGIAKWIDVNEKLISTKIDQVWDAAAQAAARMAEAVRGAAVELKELWKNILPVREGFKSLGGTLKKHFEQLPQGLQDLLKMGAGLVALSTALIAIGGSIPLIGGLAVALGRVLNPLTLIAGLFGFVVPLVKAVGIAVSFVAGLLSIKVWLVVGAVAGLIAGMVLLVKHNETARKGWIALTDAVRRLYMLLRERLLIVLTHLRDWWLKNEERIKTIGSKLIDLAGTVLGNVLKAFAALIDLLVGSAESTSTLEEKLAKVEKAFDLVLNVVEALVDVLDGDFNRAVALAIDAMAFLIDGLAETVQTAIPLLKLLGIDLPAAVASTTDAMRVNAEGIRLAMAVQDEAMKKVKEAADAAAQAAKESTEEIVVGAQEVTEADKKTAGGQSDLRDRILEGLEARIKVREFAKEEAAREAAELHKLAEAERKKTEAAEKARAKELAWEIAEADAHDMAILLTEDDIKLMESRVGQLAQLAEASRRGMDRLLTEERQKTLGMEPITLGEGAGQPGGEFGAKRLKQPPRPGLEEGGMPDMEGLFDATRKLLEARRKPELELEVFPEKPDKGPFGGSALDDIPDPKLIGVDIDLAKSEALLRESVPRIISVMDQMLKEAVRLDATSEQLKQLNQLRENALALMNAIKGTQGELRDAAEEAAEAAKEAYLKAFENIEAGSKKTFVEELPKDAEEGAMKIVEAIEGMVVQVNEALDDVVMDVTVQRNGQAVGQQQRFGIDAGAQTQNFLSGIASAMSRSLTFASFGRKPSPGEDATEEEKLEFDLRRAMASLFQLRTNRKRVVAGFGFGGGGIIRQARQLREMDRQIAALIAFIERLERATRRAPRMADGGIVSQPTLAMIGEAGPEAVIPLSRLRGLRGGVVLNAYFNKKYTAAEADQLLHELEKAIGRGGGDPTGRSPLRQTRRLRQPHRSRIQ